MNGMGLVLSKVHLARETLFSAKYLLYTNVGISVTLSALGDILEQHYEIVKGELAIWNPRRTRNMAISGAAIGFICHHWYAFLDIRVPGRSLGIVLKKTMIDQLVCSPLCIFALFLTVGALEGSDLSQLKREIAQKWGKLYAAEWIVWPPAQIFNFYFLPTRYRVLYDNTISLGYDVYTSHVKHADTD